MSGDDVSQLSFEEALSRLDALIETLERGEVPLNEAVEAYERGIALSRHCGALLDKTEATITRLLQGDDEGREVPFQVNQDQHDADGAAGNPPRARRVSAAPSADPGLFPGVAPTPRRASVEDINPDEIPF